jgi:hypothetical protein
MKMGCMMINYIKDNHGLINRNSRYILYLPNFHQIISEREWIIFNLTN